MLLRPHVGQGHPGVLNAHDVLHIGRAHQAELQQHLRAAVHVGAPVDEHEKAVGARHYRGKGHPLDAPHPLDDGGGPHHQGAAVPGAGKGVAPALGQGPQSHRHRAVCFLPDDAGGLVLHGQQLAAGKNFHPSQLRGNPQLLGAGLQTGLVPGEKDVHSQLLPGLNTAQQNLLGGVVPAKGVYDDFHTLSSTSALTALSRKGWPISRQ